ncbi:phage tail protein [Yersinia enterocolitica]|uniref:phage tail protein n=1 Tax=Yersinia enterocolitica TaxID=630 RepID=UPI0005E0DB67|nr:phage tail protein [Yersinia enterocolitica]CNI62076.1 tail fiber repeat 2-containing protein [Yersinia enterocolitica]
MNNIMPPINTPDNAFHDGNPATGEQGTIVPGLWLNNSQGATRNIQQEIISVLAEAEIEIDETKDNQLLTAILSLITASIPDLPVASLTQAGIVKLISSLTSDSESLAATAKAVKLVANAIVTSMSDHIQTANPHHQYLAIANFLSEIKDVGPAAVAQTLLNLGLGDAAKKGIATNAEMQVGTADKLVSLVGLISIFGKRTFTANDYIRIPDVPGGLIIQFGTATTLASGDTIVTFPIPFPNKVLGIHPSQNNSYTNGAWAAYASKSLSSFALSGWTNATTRIAISVDYFAVGY